MSSFQLHVGIYTLIYHVLYNKIHVTHIYNPVPMQISNMQSKALCQDICHNLHNHLLSNWLLRFQQCSPMSIFDCHLLFTVEMPVST